jgi:uncharacterized damage-inducible protein DinB
MDAITLFEYNVKVRGALLSALRGLTKEELAEDRGISFGSLRETIFHIIRVEDFWVNEFLRGAERMVAREDLEGIATVDDLEALWERVSTVTRRYVQGLKPRELSEVREVQARGSIVRKSVEEYIFTFLLHEIYHKGEVLAVMWQMGVEPPPVDYWRY